MPGSPDSSEYMRGLPPAADRLVTREVRWQDPPYNRWAFQHVREFIPTASIHRGSGPTSALERRPRDVLGVPCGLPDGKQSSVGEWLTDSFTDGFLVLHQGRVAAEHYFNHMRPHTTHLLQSVSKSIVGTLAGILSSRDQLGLDGRVTDYIPELAGSSFEGATVQQLLDMRTGTRFNEDYEDPDAEVRAYETVMGWAPPLDPPAASGLYEYISRLENASDHGGPFAYRSILTDLLGWVLERASGLRLPELLSREIWIPMGAEFDADVTVDRHGSALADGGICATLRDMGRFGQMYLQGGIVQRPERRAARVGRRLPDGQRRRAPGLHGFSRERLVPRLVLPQQMVGQGCRQRRVHGPRHLRSDGLHPRGRGDGRGQAFHVACRRR